MIPGETKLSGGTTTPCDICGGTEFPMQVMSTPAGFYVGTACGGCGCPESRETGYMTRPKAEKALERMLAGDTSDART